MDVSVNTLKNNQIFELTNDELSAVSGGTKMHEWWHNAEVYGGNGEKRSNYLSTQICREFGVTESKLSECVDDVQFGFVAQIAWNALYGAVFGATVVVAVYSCCCCCR